MQETLLQHRKTLSMVSIIVLAILAAVSVSKEFLNFDGLRTVDEKLGADGLFIKAFHAIVGVMTVYILTQRSDIWA